MHLSTTLWLFLATLVASAPPPCPANQVWDGKQCQNFNSIFCTAVNSAVSMARQQPAATTFCSSYLSIPVITSTRTQTSTLTATTTTTTTSGTTTVTDISTTVSATVTDTTSTTTTFTERPETTTTTTTIETTTVTSCPSPTAPLRMKKRAIAAPPAPRPTALAPYISGTALSSACSCISVVPSTTIASTTTSTTSTSTITSTVPSTSHATTTFTKTGTVTTTNTFSETVTSTVTRTSTSTSTTTVASIPTFHVLVQGGDNNGEYVSYQGSTLVNNQPDVAASQQFTIDPAGNLILVGGGAYDGRKVVQAGGNPILLIEGTSGAAPADETSVTCSIVTGATDGSCPLACSSAAFNRGTISWDCGVYWRLTDYQDCNVFTPYILS